MTNTIKIGRLAVRFEDSTNGSGVNSEASGDVLVQKTLCLEEDDTGFLRWRCIAHDSVLRQQGRL